MAARFLFNATFWNELKARIRTAKGVRAAVAYVGTGATRLLPLRKGDKLLVDMSLRAVRSGTTDPREIRRFLRRGVDVFSRGSLHAKFFVIDGTVVAGSANISGHSRNDLDEAAVVTDDGAAVRGARATFEQMCSEPVRKDYLAKCIAEYRPPRFGGGSEPPGRKGRTAAVRAKVWIIAGLVKSELPKAEEDDAERVVRRMEKKLLEFERSEVDYTHYPALQKYFSRLREGDWLINCVRDGAGFEVEPPGRFLGVKSYPRRNGKRRYLVTYEAPTGANAVRWAAFRSAAPRIIPAARRLHPRTSPIVRAEDGDSLLRLWNARGRFRGRKTR